MNLYDKYILPELIQLTCSNRRFSEMRQSLLPLASGRVLEIGMGSGLNLPFYNRQNVEHIFGLEPCERLRKKTQTLATAFSLPVELSANGAEDIPLNRQSVDTIVSTFTLCTISDIEQALQEMRRVLKPDGMLIFCEHGRAPEHQIQRWQDRINPWWKKIAGGCNLNRDIDVLIKQSGFTVQQSDYQYMHGPRAFSYIYTGIASPG